MSRTSKKESAHEDLEGDRIAVTITLAVGSLAAVAQVTGGGAFGSSAAAKVVGASGSLRVPENYRETYQALGSWAIAADGGAGSKEMHEVYASPGAIAAYQKMGHFPDGTVLVKEVFGATTASMTTGTVSHPEALKGWFVMVRDAKNSHPGNPLWGGRLGMVMVRCGKAAQNDVDGLQVGLPGLPRAGQVHGLDLRQRVSGPSTRRLTHGGRVV